MDEIKVTFSAPPEAVHYTVSCVVKGESVSHEVVADHIETGTHWVKFFNGGKTTGVFSAGTLISVKPIVPLGVEAKAAKLDALTPTN